MYHNPRENLGVRANALTEGLRNDAISHFEGVLKSFGYEAEVKKVPGSISDIAVFILNQNGSEAISEDVYQQFLNGFYFDRAPYDPYSSKDFTIDYWRDGRPYLKMNVVD